MPAAPELAPEVATTSATARGDGFTESSGAGQAMDAGIPDRPRSAWARSRGRERLVAILDADTVVVPDARGLPARFRVGDRLPSGARVTRIDPTQGSADTDRGTLHLE